MNVTITPAGLAGSITPPPSKSQAHRLLIAAALAAGESAIANVAPSQDIEATVSCMRELGADLQWTGDGIAVRGMGACAMSPLRRMALPRLDCGESGSTLRFLIPVALAVRGGGSFTGRGRLMERPQKPYFDLFDEKKIFYHRRDGMLTVQGLLPPGEYRLPGDVSSQFVTGLLYALPLLAGDSAVVLTSALESAGYVAMTLEALEAFGVEVEERAPGRFHVPGGQTFQAGAMAVEADWSQAGFWFAANFLGGHVEIRGLSAASSQGDARIAGYARALAAPGEVELDISQCPDLAPPLAAMAALREGTTRLTNAARLRIKESDRLRAIAQVLAGLGAEVAEGPDSLSITGRASLAGGAAVDSCGDHRIAMMAAVAACRCQRPVTVLGAECVAKSYPTFWEDYEKLGGKLTWSEE